MGLPGKERIRPKAIDPIRVSLNIDREPYGEVRYKDELWDNERVLTIKGRNKEGKDLIPNDIPFDEMADIDNVGQYFLFDDEMNVYEAFILVKKTDSGYIGLMKAIKSKPSK